MDYPCIGYLTVQILPLTQLIPLPRSIVFVLLGLLIRAFQSLLAADTGVFLVRNVDVSASGYASYP